MSMFKKGSIDAALAKLDTHATDLRDLAAAKAEEAAKLQTAAAEMIARAQQLSADGAKAAKAADHIDAFFNGAAMKVVV